MEQSLPTAADARLQAEQSDASKRGEAVVAPAANAGKASAGAAPASTAPANAPLPSTQPANAPASSRWVKDRWGQRFSSTSFPHLARGQGFRPMPFKPANARRNPGRDALPARLPSRGAGSALPVRAKIEACRKDFLLRKNTVRWVDAARPTKIRERLYGGFCASPHQ